MTCPDELALATFVDGELDAPEAVALREHAARCARCRELLAAVRAERELLSAVLQEGLLEDPAPEMEAAASWASDKEATAAAWASTVAGRAAQGNRWRELASLAIAVSVVVVAASLAAGVGAIWRALPVFDWLNPFHPSGQLTWLFTGSTLALFEGGPLLTSLATAISQAASVLLLLAVVLSVARATRRAAVTGLLAVVFAALAAPGEAFVVRPSDGDVVVPAGETIDDTLIASGNRIVVEGTVTGDVIAGGRHIVIRGKVGGNLIGWAQYVEVEGEIGGSVFASGQEVTIRGPVGGGVHGFAQHVRVIKGSRVAGSVASFAQTLAIDGVVGRDVHARGAEVDVTGVVRRDLDAEAMRITLGAGSRVGGVLTAKVVDPDDLRVEPGATVGGAREVVLWGEGASVSPYLTRTFYVRQTLWLLAAFLTGWLLFRLAPGASDVRFETPAAAIRTLGVGLLCVCTAPVAAIIAAVTLVGLPVAAVVIGLWALAIYLAKIPVALFLGRTILGPSGRGGLVPALLVGLLAVFVAVELPVIGWVIDLALTLIGVGVLCTWVLRAYRASRTVPA